MTELMTWDEAVNAAIVLLSDPTVSHRPEWGNVLYNLFKEQKFVDGWYRDVPAARDKIHVACLGIPR